MKAIPATERIIFALDFATTLEAQKWIDLLTGPVRFFKVGLQLFLAGGWPIIDYILKKGHRVMLDLKFFDIPQTVHLAVRQLNGRGITFATIHGNRDIVEAAVAAQEDINLLAVTVLTSMAENDLRETGAGISVEELVLRRARQAIELGCSGVVASAQEAGLLRSSLGNEFFLVTPGIRMNDAQGINDQRRIATPSYAISKGADYLVIGRPISKAPDPLKAVTAIQEEIKRALSSGSL
jgi:orotidine-5'-phosphate decarboxylase